MASRQLNDAEFLKKYSTIESILKLLRRKNRARLEAEMVHLWMLVRGSIQFGGGSYTIDEKRKERPIMMPSMRNLQKRSLLKKKSPKPDAHPAHF